MPNPLPPLYFHKHFTPRAVFDPPPSNKTRGFSRRQLLKLLEMKVWKDYIAQKAKQHLLRDVYAQVG